MIIEGCFNFDKYTENTGRIFSSACINKLIEESKNKVFFGTIGNKDCLIEQDLQENNISHKVSNITRTSFNPNILKADVEFIKEVEYEKKWKDHLGNEEC